MFPCRFALTRAAPIVRGSCPIFGHVSRMSSGNVPGSSGENLFYFAVVGGATIGAGIYVYRTLCRDAARYQDRVSTLGTRAEAYFVPKPWPPKYDVAAAQELDNSESHVNDETGEVEAVHVSTTQLEETAVPEEPEPSAPQAEEESLPRAQEGGKPHEEETSSYTSADEAIAPHELGQVSTAIVQEATPSNDDGPSDELTGDTVPESVEDSSSAEQVTLSHEPVQSTEATHSNYERPNEESISDAVPESAEDSSSEEQVTLRHEPFQSTEETTSSTAS
ncbi:protein MGARP isoform X2 [Protopterus annectens]|uniref:protein MGARP isoform X2 n=1 Tax=Protopterus annectens TaxID=7888 RepID=UPI001CFA81A7|nr:protein MGARP isoform X2 [Protopterus annectens]